MRVKDRSKTQILGATRPAATGALSRSKDRRNRAIRESLFTLFALLLTPSFHSLIKLTRISKK